MAEEYHRVMEKGNSQKSSSKRRKGGFITLPFIIANEALEKVPSFALLPSMMLYVRTNYNFTISQGHNLISLWQGLSNFTPILGAFFADSYMGRFVTIGLGSISSFLGVMILLLTTVIPNARPPPCDHHSTTASCKSATTGQLCVLAIALFFKSIGAGGIRPCSMPFGAEQLINSSEKTLESYFSWYFAAATFAGVLGLTVIVSILQTYGWTVGYAVCASLMLLATLSFYAAASLYIKRKASTSLFTGFAQVIVASYRNRDLPFPSKRSDYHIGKSSSEITVPSEKLRFLNKACIKRNTEEAEEEMIVDPWRLCAVHKVEELKALLKVIPMWSTAIMMGIASNQHSFPVLQASTMNRRVFGRFEIPAASLSVFAYGTIVIWIFLYERVIIPLASKIRGKQVYISVTLRMGIGLFLSAVAMGLTAMVEKARLSKAHQEGKLQSSDDAIVNMSVLWLLPQNIMMGLSESFNALGQFEFYHREFPKTMSSIGNSLFFLSIAVGYILNTALFNIINQTTSKKGNPSWVADNLNEARFDNYYWLLAGLSLLNVLYYIICVRSYGNTSNVVDEGYVSEEEEE